MSNTSRQRSMLTWAIVRKGLAYILSGKFYVRHAHLPITNHVVPNNFIGICVASSDSPEMDDYVITELQTLGIRQVRLDFSYGDLTSFNARFLERLISENFSITLHLIQPFAHAKNMQSKTEQTVWQTFLEDVLNRYGKDISRVEIGSTINRKRWAGYTFEGFLNAWDIAFKALRRRNIPLAGPNVTDFEPIYNIGILDILRAKDQLPDIHTNNLFSERVSEPERFDHRVLKYRWATIFKFNLIKKARLLRKISADFDIKHFISPVAFWAIYRIQRLLPDGEQKQADYAARYMLLNAASGALDQAYWGALICHREGLIDDGLNDAEYPALERVTYYKNVDGHIQNFWRHASFYALKTVANIIQGADYQRAISTANGLEVHHFQTTLHDIHALWTINGKVALLDDVYDIADLQKSEALHRDGNTLTATPLLISETPIYLRWPKNQPISIKDAPSLAKDLAIHAHIKDFQYYPFRQEGWFGLILARNAAEAIMLSQQLHPDKLTNSQKTNALRHARNAIWALPDPRTPNAQITVKQPVKMYPHKALLDRLKPSKAKRSWNGAVELLRRGINTAHPIAFFEKVNDKTLKQNFYICDYVKADCSIGEMFVHFAKGNKEFHFKDKNISITAEETFAQLANFLHLIHKSGTFFRDLSGGNVLVQIQDDKKLNFSLIDTARAWFYTHPTPIKHRISDLTRICNKLHWQGRKRLIGLYFANMGRKPSYQVTWAMHLYDFKVSFKRKFGRKGIKRLLKKIKK